MNEQEKKEYHEKYNAAKKKGVLFFPEILWKDAVVALLVFIVLATLVVISGSTLEEPANPADTTYTPRPEWYFLFLYQLLKYFPGNLEVIGTVVLPGIAFALLFALPFLDKGKFRYFTNRPIVIGATALVVVGIIVLTVLSLIEAPPPEAEASQGEIAMLYTQNCSGCHGASITVSDTTNLHEIIAKGDMHVGMPAWSADLSTDQIDGLVGFILEPNGNQLFIDNCSKCHDIWDRVAISPFQLSDALEKGKNFEPHSNVDEVPDFTKTLSSAQRIALLNFLIAPDGQRLFTINCSKCHGSYIETDQSEEEIRAEIVEGGMHLDMPAMAGTLTANNLNTLAQYVVDPASKPEAKPLFEQYCAQCHGQLIPSAESIEAAKTVIESGGAHEEMPVWGDVLTDKQIDALVAYIMESKKGTSSQAGQQIYMENCSSCHGVFGQGGPNPAVPGDLILPISTEEYLKTRDDATLRLIISEGQPMYGMSPYGDLLDSDQIDAVITFMRTWEETPPLEELPEYTTEEAVETGPNAADLFSQNCARCHGENAEGGIGPSLRTAAFKEYNAEEVIAIVTNGVSGTKMPSWADEFTPEQIAALADFLLNLPDAGAEGEAEGVSFTFDVMPVLEQYCTACHGSAGGWDGTTYDDVVNSGDNGPTVIAGDPDNSLLAQKILGTHDKGMLMPPAGKMPDEAIQVIIDWIAAGAPDN